ncbi:glycoside hydrolase family 3 N-terminal domain-containing protein [Actinacidiphila paucisporea]|uniref:Glycosyl hydrolase family 3 N terminal domain-containing protein n=1 Tax=Actinacidiphila paucisporea TaxID=310782 RepID=A0A1M7AXS3_9ACTN|nr:glycoside hydrolase family 3 N-terminal domain-containing protein [Actinacidiphila paucisporea]SHL47514.1 Glycosyl hydrolase family 3 N terminal domain-containing protein [Actinacidiphila paucisporea]
MLRRLTALVDSCLLPTVRGRHGRLPEWILRGLDNGTPGVAVDTQGPAARATADALRAALPDALTGHPGPARQGAGGDAAAAGLVAAGANLHLAVRPGLRADETRVFVTDLQTHGVAAALGPFTAAGSLRPFAEGAAAGVRAITAGRTPVPDDGQLPAMLSARAVTGVLRGELGYGGVVLSDTLDAPTIVDGWGVPGAAVLAWIAGVDLVRLGPSSGAGVRDAIHAAAARAVADGDLPQSRLEEAAERVARLRRWASEPRMPRMPAAEPAPAAGTGAG